METAIVVAVHEAAPAIDAIRRVHTRAGVDGAPAHVTLIYPFMDGELLTPDQIRRVADVVARYEPFDVILTELRRFDGAPDVLYLAPEPPEPFVALTAALAASFPEYPPYGGVYEEIVPHLTVAEGDRATLAEFEREVAPRLPVEARVTDAGLFQRDAANRWWLRQHFPLGPASNSAARRSRRRRAR